MSEILSHIEKDKLINGYRSLIGNLPDHIDFAREMADDRGESYRNLVVGNVGIALDPARDEPVTVSDLDEVFE
jgi:hypothetical protein